MNVFHIYMAYGYNCFTKILKTAQHTPSPINLTFFLELTENKMKKVPMILRDKKKKKIMGVNSKKLKFS